MTTMASATSSTKRTFFSNAENMALVEAVQQNKDVLLGRLTMSVTKDKKISAWNKVAEAVNSIAGMGRTGLQCEKRWYNLQSKAIHTVADYKKETNKTGQYLKYFWTYLTIN
jgi:exosome complex RNA-binding protein Rrp42 (RNase PH superfamily)